MPETGRLPAPAYHPNGHQPLPQPPTYIRAKTPRRVRQAMAAAAARQRMRPAEPRNTRVWLGPDADVLAASYETPQALPATKTAETDANQPVVRPMPRRVQARGETLSSYTRPQAHLHPAPRIGPVRLARRLGVYLGALLVFVLGTGLDRLRGRDTQARRAVRLRQTFERVGGTFVKTGQQMASRLDLLPMRYCEELGNMLDHFPAIPTEQAIAVIERTTGRRLE